MLTSVGNIKLFRSVLTKGNILRLINPLHLENIVNYPHSSYLSTTAAPYQSAFHRVVNSQSRPTHDGRSFVMAYNLSEELKIQNFQSIIDSFTEYYAVQIPADLETQAVMLSLNTSRDLAGPNGAPKPLHDIFLFREGSIVFWGVPYDQQKRILYQLSSLKIGPYSSDIIQEEKDQIEFDWSTTNEHTKLNRDVIRLSSKKNRSELIVDQFTASHAIATSVKLGTWEALLDRYIGSISWITLSMKTGARINMTRSEVFQKTGEIYELKHRINLSSDLLDLPDIYWDRAHQEALFISLLSFLNVRRRTIVINEKLNHCCELMNLLSGHMNDKHHSRLEISIIILILMEVLFELAHFIHKPTG